MAGLSENPALLLRLMVVPKVAPPSIDLLYKISTFPGVSSCHTTYTLFPDAAMAGTNENPALLLRLMVAPKVAPPSVDLLYKISSFPSVVSRHTTYTLF